MKPLTVRELARRSGVSVRTLHHYDHCGLLQPAQVGANGYRYYGEAQFLRLQQILLHRELGLSLRDIATVLDAAAESRVATLREQRAAVATGIERRRRLLATLDRTIAHLEGELTLETEQLFEGFESPQQAEYEQWLVTRNGPSMHEHITASREHLQSAGADGMRARMAELDVIEAALADQCRAGTAPDSTGLASLVERHRLWVGSMWGRECSHAAHAGLAGMYLAHPDFVARYEARLAGFTLYLADAMRANAARRG